MTEEGKMLFIIMDTNTFYNNWHLRGPSMFLIEQYISIGKAKLFLPKIVVQEVKNLYRREIEKAVSHVHQINRLTSGIGLTVDPLSVSYVAAKYSAVLDSRLESLGVEIVDYSQIPHDRVVERALSRRRPFRESDKGYRDTLVWESLLQIAGELGDTLYFISENAADFADGKQKGLLHPDLVHDLQAAGLEATAVHYYHQLKLFTDAHIEPELKPLIPVLHALRRGAYDGFSLIEWFKQHREEIVASDSSWLDPLFSTPAMRDFDDPEVRYIEDPEAIEVVGVKLVDEETIYIDARMDTEVMVDIFVEKSRYYDIADTYRIEVMDDDWNEQYVWAQLLVPLSISMTIIFDVQQKHVEEFEIHRLPAMYGLCRECGAPVMSDSAERCSVCDSRLYTLGL